MTREATTDRAIEVYCADSREGNMTIFAEALDVMCAASFPSLVTGPWDEHTGAVRGLVASGEPKDLDRFGRWLEPRLRNLLAEGRWARARV